MRNAFKSISIVIPLYNEAESLKELWGKLAETLGGLSLSWEVVFVDDGSIDNTFEALKLLRAQNKAVKVVKFRRNFGQTAALDAGFKVAGGDVVITLDGDLQNDPQDIPLLLSELEKGVDVVCGWRHSRKDPISKKIFSRLADLLRKVVLQDVIHDSGCTFRAYRRECLQGLHLYADMHRFIPELLRGAGYKICEVRVQHHARRYGKTKYNFFRFYRGFLDLLVLKFWTQYSTRPVHFFGGLGLLLFSLGFASASYLSILKVFFGEALSRRPLLILSVLWMIVGIQFFLFGLLADIVIQIYYGSKEGRPTYVIEESLGSIDRG